MTAPSTVVIHHVEQERRASVGFRLADPTAAAQCRATARGMLERFQLLWVPELADDVAVIVTELVTNACKYAGGAFPAGSLTMWHPNRRLIITVHDKNPDFPPREFWRRYVQPRSTTAIGGRGLPVVVALAGAHCGEFDFAWDGNREQPGKVARVNMLLPNVVWPHTYRDPWTGRLVQGRRTGMAG